MDQAEPDVLAYMAFPHVRGGEKLCH